MVKGCAVACGLIICMAAGSALSQENAPAPQAGTFVEGTPVLDYDTGPKPIRITKPKYPAAAFEKGIEGTVLIELLIDERGRVTRTRILKSVTGLDDAAVACVKQWRFKPAEKHGKPVPTIAHAPVAFRRETKANEKL